MPIAVNLLAASTLGQHFATVTRRHALLVLLLLPFLVARSVLPSGFMWAPGTDASRIIFCPDQTSLALAPKSVEHVHAHHHAGMQHDGSAEHGSHAHSGSQCPFAVAAVTAPPAFIAGIVTTATASLELRIEFSVPVAGIDALRAHPIRGPPALS